MKRIALLMISLLLCFAAGAAAENLQPASDEVYECGDYLYILMEDGTAAIINYTGAASELEVPGEVEGHPVAYIADEAFYQCDSLASVTLPNSVTSIGKSAFSWCGSLASVTLPDSVTFIGDSAFYSCGSLTGITLPDSVVSMGGNPFAACSKLQTIAVSPDHPNLAVADNVLFDKTEKKLICYPAGLDAANYEIPQGITAVGDSAFSFCFSLTSITLPDSVTSIGKGAFDDCAENLVLTVGQDSYAMQYAVDNGIQYTCGEADD